MTSTTMRTKEINNLDAVVLFQRFEGLSITCAIKQVCNVESSKEIEWLDFNVIIDKDLKSTMREYMVCVVDARFNSAELFFATALEHTDNNGIKSYQWQGKDCTKLVENSWKPCNPCWDDEMVVGFFPLK